MKGQNKNDEAKKQYNEGLKVSIYLSYYTRLYISCSTDGL